VWNLGDNPFFLVAFEENLGEFAHKLSLTMVRAVCVSNLTRFWVEIMVGGMLNPRYPNLCHPDYNVIQPFYDKGVAVVRHYVIPIID